MNGVGVQLDLFSPDRLSLGEARETLHALDFERAAMLYRQIIARWPEAGEAREGLAAATRWNEILSRIESGDPRSAPRMLWEEIWEATANVGSLPEGFRAALLRRVRDMLRNLDADPVPPDLSQGDVLLELDRPTEAVWWAREAMERFPDNVLIKALLAEASWQAGNAHAAREAWAGILLLSQPGSMLPAPSDLRLTELIDQHGPRRAAVEGWLVGLLPLLPPGEVPAVGDTGVDVYRHLTLAEAARRTNDWDETLKHRRWLRENAPNVLERYIAKLEGWLISRTGSEPTPSSQLAGSR